MQLARQAKGQALAARQGLNNSTLAVQAGQQVALQAAPCRSRKRTRSWLHRRARRTPRPSMPQRSPTSTGRPTSARGGDDGDSDHGAHVHIEFGRQQQPLMRLGLRLEHPSEAEAGRIFERR